ncbi:cytidylyltransferase family-domain-containing protein [Triangularia setosa]|uniref:Phosphatidate cytidylyltransferase n=1 Tax=Triangularia setosa TaxID=2587417 RepID=A0AAN6W2E6_9PEZI|nr:cytidylyltransferase family-domain-containing protein [Podospora setosa]
MAGRQGGGTSVSQADNKTESGREPGSKSLSKPNSEETKLSAPPPSTTVSEYEKKKANFLVRTFWTFVMIAGFFAALFAGHIYVVLIITAIQIVSFKEVIAIANVSSRARDLRFTKSLNWYWLATTMYFLYGESVVYYFRHIILVDKVLQPLSTHHRFISFCIYIFGFVFFVGTLKPGHLRFQFSQFAWTHMALFLINIQAHFILNNIFEGLIWFFLPAALVITNDIFAYICGITFGRTQLIKLSPKKTVEGFLGAWIMTMLFGVGLTHVLLSSNYFICPATNLATSILQDIHCEPNPVFIARTYTSPEFFFLPPGYTVSVTLAPLQIHALVWATFASLIAPFGGFFASGLKRSFKIKDFGDSIPGHGGMTDRMDCQFIMGMFAFLYYQTFIAVRNYNPGAVLDMMVTGLSIDDQAHVLKSMLHIWARDGVIPPTAADQVLGILGDNLATASHLTE